MEEVSVPLKVNKEFQTLQNRIILTKKSNKLDYRDKSLDSRYHCNSKGVLYLSTLQVFRKQINKYSP